jgi:hypothetical protein
MSLYCPKGHILSPHKGDIRGWHCNSMSKCVGDCNSDGPHIAKTAWRCSQDKRVMVGGTCDFDLCGDCIKQQQSKSFLKLVFDIPPDTAPRSPVNPFNTTPQTSARPHQSSADFPFQFGDFSSPFSSPHSSFTFKGKEITRAAPTRTVSSLRRTAPPTKPSGVLSFGATGNISSMELKKIAKELENIEAIGSVMESEEASLGVLHVNETGKLVEVHKQKKEAFLKSQKIAFRKFIQEQKEELEILTDKQKTETEQFKRTKLNNESKHKELQIKIQGHLTPSTTPVPSSDIPECPVCLEEMKPPLKIFTCGNGHLICSTCRPKVSICTNCREKYTGRATAVEQIIRKMLKLQ